MLNTVEFIAFLLKVLTWALVAIFVFLVLPAMLQLAAEELFGIKPPTIQPKPDPYQGRHWRDPQDYAKKMYIISFVNRYRETHGGINTHRRLRHG